MVQMQHCNCSSASGEGVYSVVVSIWPARLSRIQIPKFSDRRPIERVGWPFGTVNFDAGRSAGWLTATVVVRQVGARQGHFFF